MRLTILNQFYVPDISPTAYLAASLAEHRAARGDGVTVIASYGGYVTASGDDVNARATENPRVVRIWTPELGKRRKLFRIVDYTSFYLGAALRLLTMPRQDVIISLTTPPFVAATAVLHKILHRRTRLVLWNMDCYPEVAERTGIIRESGLLARMMRMLNGWILARVDDLVSLDTAMQELLLSRYAPRSQVLRAHIIPNWERAVFFPAHADPKPWEEADSLGLRERFVVLYLGNTGYGHRFDTVLEAAYLLRDDPVAFLFIGGGSRWQEIVVGAKERGLTNVVMRGYVPKEQTPSVMKIAHCALITLQDFALGVMSPSKLHSNLAMGLPVAYVGPKGSNVDDAIRKFDCGISVRQGEAVELAAWVRRMAAMTAEYTAMRDRSRQAFDNAYCDTHTLPQFDNLLDVPQSF